MPLDPDAQRVVDLIALAGQQSLTASSPEVARKQYRDTRRVMQHPAQAVAAVRDIDADGVALRLYEGVAAEPGWGLVYFHGGGWVIGDLDTHDGICRQLANLGRCRVVAVDYRLGPEHRFPAAVDDAVAAWCWVMAHAAALGMDPACIAVAGDSAGGNLAAVVALLARDGLAPPPCLQVLIYPATDLRCDSPSYARFTAGVTLTAEAMLWFRDHYLGPDGDPADWRASPLLADLAGAAPAFVLTAGYDPLCDEGVAYATALDTAGVQTMHLHLPTQVHGFLTMNRIISSAGPVLEIVTCVLRQAWTLR